MKATTVALTKVIYRVYEAIVTVGLLLWVAVMVKSNTLLKPKAALSRTLVSGKMI